MHCQPLAGHPPSLRTLTMNENTHHQAYTDAVKKYGFKPAHLLNLDHFIAPSILLVLYWIVMAGVIVFGVFSLVAGFVSLFQSFLHGLMAIVVALVMLVLLPLYVRVLFETLVVFFNINNHLNSIRENTTPKP